MTIKELKAKLEEFPEDVEIKWSVNWNELYEPINFSLRENQFEPSLNGKILDIDFDSVYRDWDSWDYGPNECSNCGGDI